jgi:predicted acetyltransferase
MRPGIRPIIPTVAVEVRPYEGTAKELFAFVGLAFGEDVPSDEDVAAFEPETELDRAIGAYDGDRMVGTAGAYTFDLTVPGGLLPAAGVTGVAVHPTERRRGVLTTLMRAQLQAIHERGEPLAVLWASEGLIYERFGYGIATWRAGMEIERSRVTFREGTESRGSFRFVAPDLVMATMGPLYERYLPMRNGTFTRTTGYWQGHIVYDEARWRRGGSPAYFLLHETDGQADAYAKYRLYPEWDARGPKGAVEVHEAIALTPQAERALWTYLLTMDLSATVRSRNLPVDTPLRLMLADTRKLGMNLTDGTWLRLVDVVGALRRRTYAARDRLVLEVRDPFLAWNEGRWQLEAMQEGGSVDPTTVDPDLIIGVADLGAAYLAGVSFAELALAGRLEECTPGAVARADALFATALAPWCPGMF